MDNFHSFGLKVFIYIPRCFTQPLNGKISFQMSTTKMIKIHLILLLVDVLLAQDTSSSSNQPLIPKTNLSDQAGMMETTQVNSTLLQTPIPFINTTDDAKKSVPRKGTPGVIKARKGADPGSLIEPVVITSTTTTSTAHPISIKYHKPEVALEGVVTDDDALDQTDYTALIVGLSLGIALVLILAAVTYWRMRDVWERRQYKRVDFLIDGLYTDT